MDLQHLQIPAYNTYAGVPLGIATNICYPWLCIIPMAILMMLGISPVISITLSFIAYMIIGFNVSFFAYRSYIRNNTGAMLFSIIYDFSLILLSQIYAIFSIGAYAGILLAPLLLFGWLNWLKNGKWLMATIGAILIIYCHILSCVILAFIFIIVTLMSIRHLNKHKWLNALKGLSLFLVCTSWLWVSLMVIIMSNHIGMTSSFSIKSFLSHITWIFPPTQLLVPSDINGWTYTDTVAIIMGLYLFKRLRNSDRLLLISGIILLGLTANTYYNPLIFMANTPIKIIQFVGRLSIGSHLFLSYILAKGLTLNSHHKKIHIAFNIITGIALFVTTISMLVGSIESDYFLGIKMPTLTSKYFGSKKVYGLVHNSIQFNDADLKANTIRYGNVDAGSNYDYAPIIVKDNKIATRKRPYKLTIHDGSMNIHTTKSLANIDLPYVLYNGQKYVVYQNGKRIHFNNHEHDLNIPKLNKGSSEITVYTPIMWYRILSLIASALGLLLLITIIIRQKLKVLLKS